VQQGGEQAEQQAPAKAEQPQQPQQAVEQQGGEQQTPAEVEQPRQPQRAAVHPRGQQQTPAEAEQTQQAAVVQQGGEQQEPAAVASRKRPAPGASEPGRFGVPLSADTDSDDEAGETADLGPVGDAVLQGPPVGRPHVKRRCQPGGRYSVPAPGDSSSEDDEPGEEAQGSPTADTRPQQASVPPDPVPAAAATASSRKPQPRVPTGGGGQLQGGFPPSALTARPRQKPATPSHTQPQTASRPDQPQPPSAGPQQPEGQQQAPTAEQQPARKRGEPRLIRRPRRKHAVTDPGSEEGRRHGPMQQHTGVKRTTSRAASPVDPQVAAGEQVPTPVEGTAMPKRRRHTHNGSFANSAAGHGQSAQSQS
jgi:hypothetical protein